MLKTVIALVVAAGFASVSFAQTGVSAPVAATVEKKIEAPKPVEPMKAEAAKAATPAKMETPNTESTPASKPGKVKKHGKKAAKIKAETATPAAK